MIRSSRVEVITAMVGDLDTVVEILDEAARWVISREWKGWEPGSFSHQSIYKQLERGEAYWERLEGRFSARLLFNGVTRCSGERHHRMPVKSTN